MYICIYVNIIPAGDPKQCGGSKRRMHCNVDDDVSVVDDDDDGDVEDDADVVDDDDDNVGGDDGDDDHGNEMTLQRPLNLWQQCKKKVEVGFEVFNERQVQEISDRMCPGSMRTLKWNEVIVPLFSRTLK